MEDLRLIIDCYADVYHSIEAVIDTQSQLIRLMERDGYHSGIEKQRDKLAGYKYILDKIKRMAEVECFSREGRIYIEHERRARRDENDSTEV